MFILIEEHSFDSFFSVNDYSGRGALNKGNVSLILTDCDVSALKWCHFIKLQNED